MKLKLVVGIVLAVLFSVKANAQKTTLPKEEIPVEITNYINQNFKDCKLRKAIKELDNNEVEYEVRLNKNIELEFDETFKIKEIDSKHEFPSQLLSVKLVEYVQTHYPDLKIREWKLIEHGQKLELSNGSEIQFDLSGNFIK